MVLVRVQTDVTNIQTTTDKIYEKIVCLGEDSVAQRLDKKVCFKKHAQLGGYGKIRKFKQPN